MHFYSNGVQLFKRFEEGTEFIGFLKDRGANHMVFKVSQYGQDEFSDTNGREYTMRVAWVPSGYEYQIEDLKSGIVEAALFMPKSARKVKLKLDRTPQKSQVVKNHSGDENDMIIASKLPKPTKWGKVIVLWLLLMTVLYFLSYLMD